MAERTVNEQLALSRDDMRQLGYEVVDLVVDYVVGQRARRVPNVGRRSALEETIAGPLPEAPTPPSEVLAHLQREVFSHISHADHPRFFAFIPGPSNFVSVMAETLASGFNVFGGTWIESSGPAVVELTVLDWLRQECGLPDTAGGLFVSGGSVANLTALAAARHAVLDDDTRDAVVYYSDQTHSSIDRALRILGFRPDQIRRLPSDDGFRLDVDRLRHAIDADRADGKTPFCVVANTGTTNTGAIDPLPAIADLCAREGLWLHADGAYGAAAVFTQRGKALLQGLDRVDSLALDPHKWLFQPFETGCVLVRDRHVLKDAFHILPEYLQETKRPGEEEVNFCDYGIQLTRSSRAIKLWTSLKVFGAEAFRRAIDHGFALAEYAETLLREREHWEVVTPAQMGMVSFRYAPEGLPARDVDALNLALVQALLLDGSAMLTSTRLRGRTVLRLCPINPRSTEEDVTFVVEKLEALAARGREEV